MSKQFKLPPQYQQLWATRFSQECEKITISWSNELSEWYGFAIQALDFANVSDLQIPSTKYPELFKKESMGLNVNVVAALANNLELRTPAQMGMEAADWVRILALNDEIGKSWNEITKPIHKKLQTEFEIMMNKPKLVVAAEA